MEKIDLAKQFKAEFAAPKKPVLIETTPAVYLAFQGQGAPGGERFSQGIGALYAVAFTVKMKRKFSGKSDYDVRKHECVYYFDKDQNPCSIPMEQWRWSLMIRTPDFVEKDEIQSAQKALISKGKPEEVNQVERMELSEGTCVQMLHIGPYDQEQRTIEQMLNFAGEKGLAPSGPHHEIYISDPRRVEPERLKTILRLPMRPVTSARNK
jgi:hypothetical protein